MYVSCSIAQELELCLCLHYFVVNALMMVTVVVMMYVLRSSKKMLFFGQSTACSGCENFHPGVTVGSTTTDNTMFIANLHRFLAKYQYLLYLE